MRNVLPDAEPAGPAEPRGPRRVTPPAGYVTLAELVARRRAAVQVGAAARRPRRPRTPEELEEREQVAAFLADFMAQLGDQGGLPAAVTQAVNLFRRAGVPRERWGDYLYQARAVTLERTGAIRKTAGEAGAGVARKNKAPYFFAVLADLLHLRPEEPSPPEPL